MSNLLSFELNRYQGCLVSRDLPHDTVIFEHALSASLAYWHTKHIKVVWLTITAERANLIPIAIAQSFTFHHTRDDAVILTKQLVEDAIFPTFANHTLGVGGIVFNDYNEILTVVEKHDMKDRPGHWKFPGGAVDNGELVRDAAVREVQEETGIESQFVNMIGLRHYHRGQFGTSNIYIVCRLKAISSIITSCPEEIGMAKWFNTVDYLACESVLDFNKALLRATLNDSGLPDVNLGNLHGIPLGKYEFFI